jgi:hypothetical protein
LGQRHPPRGFLLEHGEKIVLVAFGFLVMVCLLGALGGERYTRTPEQLVASLEQKRAEVAQHTPESFARLNADAAFGRYADIVVSCPPVSALDRLPAQGTKLHAGALMRKRGEPEYLAPQRLVARPLFLSVAMRPARKALPKEGNVPGGPKGAKIAPPPKVLPMLPGEGLPRGMFAVLITGTIPRRAQSDAYVKEFQLARNYDPARDLPRYGTFSLERSSDGGQTWQDTVTVATVRGPREMNFADAYWEIQKTFAGDSPEIVDTARGNYLDPLRIDERDSTTGLFGFTVTPLPPILGEEWPESVAGGFPILGDPAQRGPGPMKALDEVEREATSDFLFRFFDFTVEEGKTYQYRVAVELENPNFNLSRPLLRDPGLSEGRYRYSPFAAPTAPVKVKPPSAEVLAGPVLPARLDTGRPEQARLILVQRERTAGAFVGHIFERMEAGQTLNFEVDKL